MSGTESDSSESLPEMLATSRERRRNAGNKMAKLIENFEESDDFYKTTYGGFTEENDDFAFESPVSSDSDSADSDFDVDETALGSDEADEDDYDAKDEPKQKRGRVITKAYKEPVKKQPSTDLSKSRKGPSIKKNLAVARESPPVSISVDSERRLRATTLQKAEATAKSGNRFSSAGGSLRRKSAVHQRGEPVGYQLTQEQLLEESKITEKINLKSLERFQQWETEKQQKARKAKQRKLVGPFIRFHSTIMPIVAKDENMHNSVAEIAECSEDKQARNFVTFSDDWVYEKQCPFFAKTRAKINDSKKIRRSYYCVVTGLPARYVDPLTGLPYATVDAFKTLRHEYEKFVKEHRDED